MKVKILLIFLLCSIGTYAQKTLTASKMYSCEYKHLDIKNLNYKECPFKARNYSITIKNNTIVITDTKLKAVFDYTALTKYQNIEGFEHYVDDNADHLIEFYINKIKKLFISHSVIDNGHREVYEVYILK